MDTMKSYRTLDLEPGASAEQVRKAYKDLRDVWHTDRYLANTVLRQKAAERMYEIEEAYQTLCQFVPGLDPAMNGRGGAARPQRPEDALEEGFMDADASRPRWVMGAVILFFLAMIAFVGLLLLLRSRQSPMEIP